MSSEQARLTEAARQFYNRATQRSLVEDADDRNLLLSGDSGIVNHHFGLGDFDRAVPLETWSQTQIAAEINRLEVAQIGRLAATMAPLTPGSDVLDAGCGRGGTALYLAREFGVRVRGVNVAQEQLAFAEHAAQRAGLAGLVSFHLMDYLHLAFPPATFQHVFTNETTMYVWSLAELFGSFAGVLKPGGRYTLATWCANERTAERSPALRRAIDAHYGTHMHTREDYLQALAAAGFELLTFEDATAAAVPYWELRSRWSRRSGVEREFLTGHRERHILYLLISARYDG
jgi:geranyl diphosphate 2-C-methyltransferase